ncbi:HIT family protein [Candidatus Parcubacteria bacterium]|nr:MAG: HIT family protein [Candidatus Parcubacteria bacterium]
MNMEFSKQCLFCRIAEKKLVAWVVHEDDHSLAFLDIQPRAPGHTMVIPRRHAATLFDLSPEEIGPLFSAVQKVARRVSGALGAEGLTMGINHGRVSGQVVDHLHIHILPRFGSDRGGSIQSVVNNPREGSLEEMAKKIRETAL